MSGKTWLLVILLVSVGVNVGLLASRWMPGAPIPEADPPTVQAPADEVDRAVARFADQLRLDGSARDRFVDVHTGFFRTMIEGRREVRRTEMRLRQQLTSEAPDRGRIDELLVELTEARARIEGAFVYALLDAREVLGPRQQAAYFRALRRLRAGDGPRPRLDRRGPEGPGARRFRRPGPGAPLGDGAPRPEERKEEPDGPRPGG